MKAKALLLAVSLAVPALSIAQLLPKDQQIASAIAAAPAERRDGAAVLGWDDAGNVLELRAGTNDLICLASDPREKNFSVACYHRDLEPFMKRGRELAAQGVTGKERHAMRGKEVDEGKVPIPREPRMLYVLIGDGWDAAQGTVIKPYLRWVVYTPYATPESTGLSIEPGPHPWLMYPGTAGAHIMMSPPKP